MIALFTSILTAKVAKTNDMTKGNEGNPEKWLYFSELMSIFVPTNYIII